MLGAKLDGGAAVRPRGHFKTDAGGEARPLSEGSMLMGSSLSIVFFLSLEFQSHFLAACLHWHIAFLTGEVQISRNYGTRVWPLGCQNVHDCAFTLLAPTVS